MVVRFQQAHRDIAFSSVAHAKYHEELGGLVHQGAADHRALQ
jgi:hypothetical protein